MRIFFFNITLILLLYIPEVHAQLDFDRGLYIKKNVCWKLAMRNMDMSSLIIKNLVKTQDGGYFALGTSSGACGSPKKLNLSRMDRDMNFIWTKCYGGTSWEVPIELFQLPSGNLIALVTSGSLDGDFVADTTTYWAGSNCWVLKLDTFGNLLDKTIIGGNGTTFMNFAYMSPDYKVYITGMTSSTQGDFTGPPGAYNAACLAAVDSNLHKVFARRYEWLPESYFIGLAFTGPNSIYLPTQVAPDDTLTVPGPVHGNFDAAVLKLDSLGNTIWARRYGGSEIDEFMNLEYVPEWNQFVVNGGTFSRDQDIDTSMANPNAPGAPLACIWIGRMDTFGNLLMSKAITNPNVGVSYYARYLGRKGDLMYIGAGGGYMKSEEGQLIDTPIDNRDNFIWIAAWDSSGYVRLKFQTDYRYVEQPVGGVILNHEEFWLTGYTEHSTGAPYVVNSLSCIGSTDSFDTYFMLNLDEAPLSINQLNSTQDNKSFSVYPNPGKDELQIQKLNPLDQKEYALYIYNTYGQKIFSQISNHESKIKVDATSWSEGIYFINILIENQHQETYKFIKN